MKELLIVLKNILLTKEQDTIIFESKNWTLINKLKDYDMVFVKMNEEDIKNFHVQEGHQIRPFLIIRKQDGKQIVKGYYLTSKILKNYYFEQNKHKGLKIILKKNEYQMNKNGIILFQNEIKLPYENIISYIDELKPKDINKLKKYRDILCHKTTMSTKENQVIEIADIINHDNVSYIIYQMDNTHCYGYPIVESNEKINIEENFNYILFNNKIYFIDYKNSKKFNNEDTFYIIDRFNEEIVEIIKSNKKKLKSSEKNKSKTKTKKKKK